MAVSFSPSPNILSHSRLSQALTTERRECKSRPSLQELLLCSGKWCAEARRTGADLYSSKALMLLHIGFVRSEFARMCCDVPTLSYCFKSREMLGSLALVEFKYQSQSQICSYSNEYNFQLTLLTNLENLTPSRFPSPHPSLSHLLSPYVRSRPRPSPPYRFRVKDLRDHHSRVSKGGRFDMRKRNQSNVLRISKRRIASHLAMQSSLPPTAASSPESKEQRRL